MKTKSSPSRYRYWKSRRSTFSMSTFAPALYVLSTTFPVTTFFSLVRTNAPPLPGLTCWNSTTFQSWPSMLSTTPLRMSAVEAMRVLFVKRQGRWNRPERPQKCNAPEDEPRRGVTATPTAPRNTECTLGPGCIRCFRQHSPERERGRSGPLSGRALEAAQHRGEGEAVG